MGIRFGAALALTVLALGEAVQLPDLPRVNAADFLPVIRAQIEHAEREAKAQPRNPAAVGALAMVLHAYQKYQDAALAYSRARALEPASFDWLYLLGAAQMELGDFDAATRSFGSALELRPDDLAARLRLGQCFVALARWDEAGQLYRHILDGHPALAQAWYGLGRVQAAKADHAAAARSLGKACELFPRYGAAHFALAGELRRLGNKEEEARRQAAYEENLTAEPPLDDPLFRRVHELNRSAQVRLQRGAELERAGQIGESIREHEEALAADPASVQAHVNLISLYGRAGNHSKAKEHFDAATKLNPGRADAWYNYGVLLARERNSAEAEQAFLRAVAINPQYAEAHNNLGALYEQQGRLTEAEREFRLAVEAQPNYPLARFHLARLLVNQQKYGEAIRQLERTLDPEDDQTPVYLYALGAAHARAGNREQALKYLEKARESAVAHRRSQLLGSIERDLKTLRAGP